MLTRLCPALLCVYAALQFSAGVRGNCYAAIDKRPFKEDTWVSVCVNEDGVRTAVGDGRNAQYSYHGSYFGWSNTENAMGYGDGGTCTIKGQTIYRGALVRLSCCSKLKMYAYLTGKRSTPHAMCYAWTNTNTCLLHLRCLHGHAS